MKPNPKTEWKITLRGTKPGQRVTELFHGTIDEALHQADVMECHPRWSIRVIAITRQRKAAKQEAAA